MLRNWKADGEKVGLTFIEKVGNVIFFSKDGFTFKSYRTSWPPKKLSPGQCLEPTDYYKFLVRKLHGDLYDLSKTIFTGADDNVIATCKIHGDFTIAAKYLSSIRGCPACSIESIGLQSRSTTEQFISNAKKIHGDKYDYSNVEYVTSKDSVIIGCPIHGNFTIAAMNHLSGRGCVFCGKESMASKRRLYLDEVLFRFNKVHGDRYDYSQVTYNGDAHEHLDIICKEHGLFKQSYANHNSGKGCPTCAKEFSPRLKRGFIKSGENKNYASLYLIRCFDENEIFYKIGITTKPMNRRFGGESTLPYKYEVVNLFTANPEEIWDLEKIMHKVYKDVKYLPNKEFGGRYECFSYIATAEYVKLLNCVA